MPVTAVPGSTAFLAMPAGTMAVNGPGVLWYVVAGCALLAAGLTLTGLLPRRER